MVRIITVHWTHPATLISLLRRSTPQFGQDGIGKRKTERRSPVRLAGCGEIQNSGSKLGINRQPGIDASILA